MREEAALYDAVQQHLQREWHDAGARAARIACTTGCRELIRDDVAAGRLTLSPEPPTPLGWTLRKLLHVIGAPLLLLLVLAGHRAARDSCWC